MDDSPTDNGLHFAAQKGDVPMRSPMGIRYDPAFALAPWMFVVALIFAACVACGPSRVGGTYIAHGPNTVDMLQMTQAEGGLITGVLNNIELSADGKISSNEVPITGGAFDGKQLTLTFNPGVLGIRPASLGRNISGTMDGATIRLQVVGPNGNVLPWELERSAPDEFKTYADELRFKAGGILQTANLRERAQGLHQAVSDAEEWIANAELHAQRIPRAKEYIRGFEDEMRSLVARERRTLSSVARSQISVRVTQGNTGAGQLDIQEDQTWRSIESSGADISHNLAAHLDKCWNGAGEQFRKQGATSEAIKNWETACSEAASKQAKFEPIHKRVMEQRADLKAFQVTAESNRQALVDEASRIQ